MEKGGIFIKKIGNGHLLFHSPAPAGLCHSLVPHTNYQQGFYWLSLTSFAIFSKSNCHPEPVEGLMRNIKIVEVRKFKTSL